MKFTMRGLVSLTAAMAISGVATAAYSGGFALKERSATGQGMSFAGVTAGSGGLSSMGFNPAAIGLVERGEVAGGLSLVSPIADGEVRAGGVPTGESVDADRIGGVANGYAAYRITPDDILIGLALYTPFGLSTGYEPTFSGRADALTSKLLTFNIAPVVGFEPIDGLTVAGALNILYADARLTRGTNLAAGVPSLNLDGDELQLGFSVGAMWEVTGSTTIGVAYQHGHNLVLDGFAQSAAFPGANFPVSAAAELPATISAGIVQGFGDRFRVMGEVQWQDWSVFDRIDVSIRTPFGGIGQPDVQNYDDAFFVALGGEYDVTDALTVRAGAAWDQTPTQDSNPATGFLGRTPRVPDEDRIWLSVGGSYGLTDAMSIDAGYSYLFAIEDPVVDLRTVPGSQVVYDGGAHIFTLGGSVKF